MDRKKTAGILVLLLLLIGFWGVLHMGRQEPKDVQGELTITALPVGKADALIVECGGQAILIDTGEESDGAYIEQELKERSIERLDLMLITHFDKDHVGSAAYLLEHMDVEAVYMPDYEGTRPEYAAFLEALEQKADVRWERITEIQDVSVGDMALTVYPAEDPAAVMDTEKEYDNDLSLVTSLRYGSCSFLFTGDIEKTRIRQMLDTDVDWNHDWIKMPHHGKYEKALKELIGAVTPSYAVICCSEEEAAEQKTLDYLAKSRVETYDTARSAVVTECDGTHIAIWSK